MVENLDYTIQHNSGYGGRNRSSKNLPRSIASLQSSTGRFSFSADWQLKARTNKSLKPEYVYNLIL